MTDVHEAGAAPPRPEPEVKIRLDRSREFSHISGDRSPDDPWYGVFYMQDDLPFLSNGELAPEPQDPDKRESFIENLPTDGGGVRPVKHHPIWTEARRAIRDRKLAALRAPRAGTLERTDGPVDGDVNLTSWLKGEADYEPNQIFAAMRSRWGVNFHDIRKAISFAVFEQHLVPEGEVAGYLMRKVNQAA